MENVESTQVRIRLTSNPLTLAALRKRKALTLLPDGSEVFIRQYDSIPIHFYPGQLLTLGRTVARNLARDARVIVGDDLTGDLADVLEIMETFELGHQNPNTCGHCGQAFERPGQLAVHLNGTFGLACPTLYPDRQKQEVSEGVVVAEEVNADETAALVPTRTS